MISYKDLSKRELQMIGGIVILLVLVVGLTVQTYQLRNENTLLQETVDKQNKKIETLEKLVRIFNKDFSDLKGAVSDTKASLGRTLEKMGEALKGE
jgi:cell division protein FtsL